MGRAHRLIGIRCEWWAWPTLQGFTFDVPGTETYFADGAWAHNGEACDVSLLAGLQKRLLGRGNTGRLTPKNETEYFALLQAMSDPLAGRHLSGIHMKHPWPASEGWEKWAMHHDGVEIHYLVNRLTGQIDDFKFK